jgi:hypothetical protein
MEKDFIPYEPSLRLKAIGFDEPCLLRIQYSSGYDVYTGIKFQNSIWLGNGYDAEISSKKIKYKFPKHSKQKHGALEIPTFSQAFRWFRENYNLHGAVRKRNKNGNIYFEQIFDEDVLQNGPFNTYEEAELACLTKLIEIVEGIES